MAPLRKDYATSRLMEVNKMRNSDSFLAIFSEVERWLRSQTDSKRHISFRDLISRAAEKNAAVGRHTTSLKEYADLRNAITHERTDNHVIAEPNDRAIADFSRLRDVLVRPAKLIPRFQRNVKTRTAADPIGHAIEDMRQGSFSQVPIIDNGGVTSLLTTETVVRWLASEVKNELVSLLETPISVVLPHVEDTEHYCFLGRGESVHEAIACFEEYSSGGKDLDAILITNDGKPSQSLLGILTVYDLPDLLQEAGLNR